MPASASSARTRSRSATRTTYRCQTCSLPGSDPRQDHAVDVGEQLVVASRPPRPLGRSSRRAGAAWRRARRACSVSSRELVPTHAVLVLADAAVVAQRPHAVGELVVVGEHGAGVAVGAEVLAGVEAGGRDRRRASRRGGRAGVAPWDCAASSTSTHVVADRRAELPRPAPPGRRGARRSTARVRSVTPLRPARRGRCRKSASQSTSTRSAPTRATASAVATKVLAGTITSSPGPIPAAAQRAAPARRCRCRRRRSGRRRRTRRTPPRTRATSGPSTNAPASITSSIAEAHLVGDLGVLQPQVHQRDARHRGCVDGRAVAMIVMVQLVRSWPGSAQARRRTQPPGCRGRA